MKGLFAGEREVPLTFTGAPLSIKRACNLAYQVADTPDLSAKTLNSLIALLCGLAPSMEVAEKLREVNRRRILEKDLQFDPQEVRNLLTDLWARYTAAVEAISVLYCQSQPFQSSLEDFLQSNALIKPFGKHTKDDIGEEIEQG